MNYYIEKDGVTAEMTDSEDSAFRLADAWEEMYPDSTISILLEVER